MRSPVTIWKDLIIFVRPARLERATPRFEVWCSLRCPFGVKSDANRRQSQFSVVAGPRNHQGRTAGSRGAGGLFLLGEGQDLSQRTYHNDVAATTFLARMDFNVTYERTDNVHGLRARPLIIQDLFQLGDLPAVEIREIGMKIEHPDGLTLRVGNELTFARLQLAQLLANRARIAVSAGNKVKTSLDSALHLLKLLRKMTVTIETSFCSKWEADQLGVPFRGAVFVTLITEHRASGTQDRPFEVARAVYRADRVQFRLELSGRSSIPQATWQLSEAS